MFVPLARLQQDLEIGDRANMLLVSATRCRGPPRHGTLEGSGSKPRQTPGARGCRAELAVSSAANALAVESDGGLLDDRRARRRALRRARARQAEDAAGPHLSRQQHPERRRRIPYSLVTAIDLTAIRRRLARVEEHGRSANRAQRVGGARTRGDRGRSAVARLLRLGRPGPPRSRGTADFTWRRSCRSPAQRPIATSRRSIRASPRPTTLRDWDPPFPIDLAASGPWTRSTGSDYRTTPKAFVPLEVGQALWRSRYGSAHVDPPQAAGEHVGSREARGSLSGDLRAMLDPSRRASRSATCGREGLAASRGATDFGEYFTYFSFFLVVRRCCWRRCSSSWASSSARARSACCARSASRLVRSGGCS